MNSAALLQDGAIAFLQSKMLLPTYDVFDEMRNFAPARSQSLFSFCGKQMALTICEDAWNDKHFWNKRLYTVDPVEALVQAGGNFVLNISASPFWLGKRELRREMLATIARQDKVPVVMLVEWRPKIDNIASNVSETTTVVRGQVERLDATVTDIVDRTRLQVIRADELLNRTMDRIEETSDVVHRTVVSPVRQLSGIIQGLTAGLEFLLGGERRRRHDVSVPQDEMFI